MISIFNSLRDLHTVYVLPASYQGKLAFLPFLVEEFFKPIKEDRKPEEKDKPCYLVSKIVQGLQLDDFLGSEVKHWNGIPIARAIELNADRQAGSNRDARRAQGISDLTVRPLEFTASPDEDWVRVGYVARGGEEKECQFPWLVIDAVPEMVSAAMARRSEASPSVASTSRPWVGIDARAESARRARKMLFAPKEKADEERVALGGGEASYGAPTAENSGIDRRGEALRRGKKAMFAPDAMRTEGAVATRAVSPLAVPEDVSTMPDNFAFRTVEADNRHRFGYVRIFSFNFERPFTPDQFVGEFRRIITDCVPQEGLIIDVRGNGGGIINAGERCLQFLSPRPIEPERFHFRNSELILDLCRQLPTNFDLSPWSTSIDLAIETGEVFSQGFPLTPVAECNDVGQLYQGPVVLIIDALCYSTTDIFAAGFQDHKIGPIVGVSRRTGAGGANVWDYDQILTKYNPRKFPALPQKAGFSIAIRRSTRIGDQAGVPLEDLGVSVPDAYYHPITREDLLENNRDLIDRAIQELMKSERHFLQVEVTRSGSKWAIKVKMRNVTRVDFYVDGRPMATRDVKGDTASLTLSSIVEGPHSLKAEGFLARELVVARTVLVE
jgi:hypothetical protein